MTIEKISEKINENCQCDMDKEIGSVLFSTVVITTEILIKQAQQEERDRILQKVGLLRQWLNEDRIQDSKKSVTNEEIIHWLE